MYYTAAFCDLDRTFSAISVECVKKKYDKESVFSMFVVAVESPTGAAILK